MPGTAIGRQAYFDRNVIMKFSQARQGRIFLIRLEDGDVVHEAIERFARDQQVRAAALIIVGGADTGSRLVVGPEQGRAETILPYPPTA
jgi:predicted DNA-binding protein with PD1-like motif